LQGQLARLETDKLTNQARLQRDSLNQEQRAINAAYSDAMIRDRMALQDRYSDNNRAETRTLDDRRFEERRIQGLKDDRELIRDRAEAKFSAKREEVGAAVKGGAFDRDGIGYYQNGVENIFSMDAHNKRIDKEVVPRVDTALQASRLANFMESIPALTKKMPISEINAKYQALSGSFLNSISAATNVGSAIAGPIEEAKIYSQAPLPLGEKENLSAILNNNRTAAFYQNFELQIAKLKAVAGENRDRAIREAKNLKGYLDLENPTLREIENSLMDPVKRDLEGLP